MGTSENRKMQFPMLSRKLVVSLNSVYEYARTISENMHCKLLMQDTRSASGGAMELTTCYCPHPQCTHYGKRGGAHRVRRGADHGIPRLLCPKCKSTFSARQGTAYFGVHAEAPNYTIAMRALAEGNSLRGTGRIVEGDKDTSVTGSIELDGIVGPLPPTC